MKRLSTPEHCVDKRENAVLWNCWSLHQATLAANFLYICSMFCKFVHYPLFSIFVHYILFSIFAHFFIFVCIMNCWSLHPATPATDCGHICSFFLIFVHYFLYFSSYFIFNHYLLYLLVFGTAGRCIQQRLQPIVDDCWDNLFLAHKLLSLLCFFYLF